MSNKNVCLNMIVKDESKIIKRCLNSVKKHIDYWVIIDTGSTDGTQGIIKETMKDIPGEIHERPWKNFEHNRNEALKLAYPKAKYILFIDADEVLQEQNFFSLKNLNRDLYLIAVQLINGSTFHRQFLISTKIKWFWQGVVHEQIYTLKPFSHGYIDHAFIYANNDGGRNGEDTKEKFLKDARILEDALKKDPKNSRYVFYLAASYTNAQENEKALEQYEKRISMGGWDQEVYYSLYNIARLQKKMGMSSEVYIDSFYRAYQFRPSRAEPLFWIANCYMEQEKYERAYDLLKENATPTIPPDAMMIEPSIYEYVLAWILADSAFMLKKHDEAKERYERLLENPKVPKDIRESIQKNLIAIKWKNR